jgi:hypothetical protein
MRHARFAFFQAAFVAALCSPALADGSFLPLAEGTEWVFASRSTTGAGGVGVTAEGRIVARCEAEQTVGGQAYYAIAWSDEDFALRTWVRVRGDRIEVARASRHHLLLVPGDLRAGQPAGASLQVGDTRFDVREHAVGDPTTVTVPLNRYVCTPVTTELRSPLVKVRTTTYYARGIGPVKIVESVTTGGLAQVTRELVLVERRGPSPLAIAPRAGGREAPSTRGLAQRAAQQAQALGFTSSLPAPTRHVRLLGPVVHGGLSDVVATFDGDLEVTGSLKRCVLVVRGDLTVAGAIKDSLVLCRGRVESSAYVKGSVVAAGNLEVSGYLKQSLVEAARVEVGGYTKQNLLLNVDRLETSRSTLDDRRTARETLLGLFR